MAIVRIKETTVEAAFLLIFVGIMLWIGIADTWGHKIQHPFPYSYLASDTFQHQTRAQWIKDAGNYRYEAPYYSAGLTDVVGFYPPILNHLSVLLSYSSGLEVYDTILFLTVLFTIIGMLILYIILREWNINIALLSLPLTTYIFTILETRRAFLWGHWSALLGDFFFVAIAWILFNFEKKYSAIFLGILLSATILGHTAATVFALLFIIVFTVTSLITHRFNLVHLKGIIIALIITLAVSAYFLILFKQSWMIIYPFTFTIETDWNSGGGLVQLKHFGTITLIIMALGFRTLLFSRQPVFNHEEEKGKFFQKLFVIFSLIAGLTNYVGFTIRAFNFRFYWPITLAPLFGIALYTHLKSFCEKTKLIGTAILSLLIMMLLIKINYQPTDAINGLMNQYTWQTLAWIRDNTPHDSKPLFFYGEAYDQDGSLGNTHRINARTEIDELKKTLEKGALERNYSVKYLIEAGAGLPYKKGQLSYGLHSVENNITNKKMADLCNFNYYIFDTWGKNPQLVKLNNIIRRNLTGHNFTKVFENKLNIVLKNPTPGGACFGPNNNITL
ncbi:hypothetical protein HY485_00420 [Candidatus Woesearchaeota archaeon]|nr:hypothetical protein [Candidatus Woesearchaeota archaeon]